METHSGNDFQGGRSAIAEMAYKIIDFHNMTDLSIGSTCNIGTISGGTVPNAVPAHCEVVLDMRYTTLSGKEKLAPPGSTRSAKRPTSTAPPPNTPS